MGQCNISHPIHTNDGIQNITPQDIPFDALGGTVSPQLNFMFAKVKVKEGEEPLESRIHRE